MIAIQPPYVPIYTDKSKFVILLSGGRGSGKSFNASTFIERLSFQKGHLILFCRYTMTAAQTSVIPEFTEKIELDGMRQYFNVNSKEIENNVSGSKILFKGIKTSSGNQTANLKSIQGLTTFVGDEMEEWQSEDDFDKLILSIRQKGIQNRVILLLNPVNSEHFIYRKYIENTHKTVYFDGVPVQISTHPDVLHIHTTYMDNRDNLGEQFLNEIERIKKQSIEQSTLSGTFDDLAFSKSKYAYKIIGRWADVADGCIFENWADGEFNEMLPYCYGADFGFSVDPDTLIKVAVDTKNKKVYVHEEYYACKQLGTDAIFDMYKSRLKYPKDLIIADSSEARLIADLYKKGLNIQECEKGAGSVLAGISSLLDYTIVVTPDSNNIKRELRNYQWNDKKAGIPMQNGNDHALDSIRYAFRKLAGQHKNNLSILTTFR